jgi:hypothetical protein
MKVQFWLSLMYVKWKRIDGNLSLTLVKLDFKKFIPLLFSLFSMTHLGNTKKSFIIEGLSFH